MANVDEPAGKSREWNFHPNLPISMSPVFDFPPKYKASTDWLLGTWLKLTPPISHLLFAVVCYNLFLPSTVEMQQVAWPWLLQVSLINFGSVVLLAGVLHAYLYIFSFQKNASEIRLSANGKKHALYFR